MERQQRQQEQVHRVAQALTQAIRDQASDILQARGTVVVTIFDPSDTIRVELTVSKTVYIAEGGHRVAPRLLAGEVDELAERVGRFLRQNAHPVMAARKIETAIHLNGPRPDVDVTFKFRM